jgi:hypothetical protein
LLASRFLDYRLNLARKPEDDKPTCVSSVGT